MLFSVLLTAQALTLELKKLCVCLARSISIKLERQIFLNTVSFVVCACIRA